MKRGPAYAWGPSGPALTAVPPLQLPLQWLYAVPVLLLLAALSPVSPGMHLSLFGQKPIKGAFAHIKLHCACCAARLKSTRHEGSLGAASIGASTLANTL